MRVAGSLLVASFFLACGRDETPAPVMPGEVASPANGQPRDDAGSAPVADDAATEEPGLGTDKSVPGFPGTVNAVELDRPSGTVTVLPGAADCTSLSAENIGCNTDATADGVRFRVRCTFAGEGSAPSRTDIRVTVLDDPQHPARNGQTIRFATKVGFSDTPYVCYASKAPALQLMAVYPIWLK